jgi:hypothetical protein
MEKQVVEKAVLESINKGIEYYKTAINKGFTCYKLTIDCSDLSDPEPSELEKKKHGLPNSLKSTFFREFDAKNPKIKRNPCLYFFEFKDGLAEEVYKKYEAYTKSETDERNKSGLKGNHNRSTNILYVGKVKKDVGARLSTHFGYANAKTGGLQLRFWAKEMGLKLDVHLILFENEIDDYINPLELELTRILNPLIGKSK